MRRGQLRDEGMVLVGGGLALGLNPLRGCYISQTHTFIVGMLLSTADRLCLCVRACCKMMLSY